MKTMHQFELGQKSAGRHLFLLLPKNVMPDACAGLYQRAKKRISSVTQSSVRMLGRAILNPFLQQIKEGVRPWLSKAASSVWNTVEIRSIPYYYAQAL